MRVTDSDNAITNGLEMRQGPSGATQLMSCNNDDALRIFDAGSGFKCTGCALCQPPLSPICKPSLAAPVAHRVHDSSQHCSPSNCSVAWPVLAPAE